LSAHIVTNQISIYDQQLNCLNKLHLNGVTQFLFAPNVQPYNIATFVPPKGVNNKYMTNYIIQMFASLILF
jgi:hypothetical protein